MYWKGITLQLTKSLIVPRMSAEMYMYFCLKDLQVLISILKVNMSQFLFRVRQHNQDSETSDLCTWYTKV